MPKTLWPRPSLHLQIGPQLWTIFKFFQISFPNINDIQYNLWNVCSIGFRWVTDIRVTRYLYAIVELITFVLFQNAFINAAEIKNGKHESKMQKKTYY